MQVAAFTTPTNPNWRWRIISYGGEIVEESRETFLTIGTAVAEGAKRLAELNVVDRSFSFRHHRSTAHLRGR
jgi:hypothetical protein